MRPSSISLPFLGAALLMASQTAARTVHEGGKNATIDDNIDFGNITVSTPSTAIFEAVSNTNQTAGPPADAAPSLPIAVATVATNTSAVVDPVSKRDLPSEQRWNRANIARRGLSSYTAVSDGSDPVLSTAALQAPAYLTYTVYPNTTTSGVFADAYAAGLQKCAAFCDRTNACVSFNLYREWNNPLLDWVFSEKSNLKCALFGDVAQTSQLTNKGGQQQKPTPEPLTQITDSSVYTDSNLPSPETPAGYSLAFGPLNAALNSGGYMGYRALTLYNTTACAEACNTAAPDSVLGYCTYFNLWRGVVNNQPTTYTCSLYAGFPSSADAVNTGDAANGVKVTYSRGYASTTANRIRNPGFETDDAVWSGFESGGTSFRSRRSHSGGFSAAFGQTSAPTTRLVYTPALSTAAGVQYKLGFFVSNWANTYGSGWFRAYWNDRLVYDAPTNAFSYTFIPVTVMGTGNDKLSFESWHAPSYYYLDDVSLVPA